MQRNRFQSEVVGRVSSIVTTQGRLIGAAAEKVFGDDDAAFELAAVHVCNTTGASATVTLHFCNPGEAAGASNMRINAAAVAANGRLDLSELEGIAINPKGSIWASASAADHLSLTITGIRHYGARA